MHLLYQKRQQSQILLSSDRQKGFGEFSLEIKKSFVTTGSAMLEEVSQGCGGTTIGRCYPDSDKAGSSTCDSPVLSHRLDYTVLEVLPKHHFCLSMVTLDSSALGN